MAKRKKAGACLGPEFKGSHTKAISECKVESIVSIDERGQMVLPKEIREKAGIKTGDKLAVLNWEKAGKVCCISLIRVEDFAKMVKEHLGPMMKEIAPE
jgi:AbrB family looped-hinge helix DNA binding protein